MDIARRTGQAYSRLLMPLAYSTLLGGLTTLIGTPLNLLVSNALRERGLAQFQLFDFTPVGGWVMLGGIAFIALVGKDISMDVNKLIADLNNMLNQLKLNMLELMPKIIGAAVILMIGLLVARLTKALVDRLINRLDRLIPNQKIQTKLKTFLREKPIAKVVSGIVYWILVFFFLTVATETLGLPVVTTWLSGIAGYLPRILSAFLIGFAGLIGGIILRDLITTAATSAGIMYGGFLGKLVQIVILLVTILIGIEQIGIDVTLLTGVIMITIAALLFGAALAFGLGARTSVSNILASYYLQKTYKVGDMVQIGGMKGQIIQITALTVLLQSNEGQVSIPAKEFNEVSSVLLKESENELRKKPIN